MAFTSLNKDCQDHIFSYLNRPWDVRNIELVCKLFRDVSRRRVTWIVSSSRRTFPHEFAANYKQLRYFTGYVDGFDENLAKSEIPHISVCRQTSSWGLERLFNEVIKGPRRWIDVFRPDGRLGCRLTPTSFDLYVQNVLNFPIVPLVRKLWGDEMNVTVYLHRESLCLSNHKHFNSSLINDLRVIMTDLHFESITTLFDRLEEMVVDQLTIIYETKSSGADAFLDFILKEWAKWDDPPCKLAFADHETVVVESILPDDRCVPLAGPSCEPQGHNVCLFNHVAVCRTCADMN